MPLLPATARAAHPERFATTYDPQILALPEHAWIDPPGDPAEPTGLVAA